MLRRVCSNLIGIPLLLAILAIHPVVAQTSESAHRDNSGRQLAIVVPGMPHPTAALPVVTVPAAVRAKGVSGTPVDIAAALRTGVIVAKDISDTYTKRARDFATFAGVLWGSLGGVPLLSPLSSPPAPARPLHLPQLSSTLEP
jgi:hypothetical protein